MKKILFLISFLALSYLHADTVTSGSVGLLLPTTGVVDVNRSWADKYNTNFSIVASSIGTSLSSLQSSSNTLFSEINSTGVALSNFTTSANSTMTALSNSTSTLYTQLTATSVADSNFVNSANSTMTALSNSTNTFINAGRNNAGVIFSSMTTGFINSGSNNAGVVFSTMTSGLPTTTTPRSYTLYVGTPGTPNVDSIVGGAASFDAILASVAAHGLTTSNTAQATILFNPGVYQVSNGTIPAGVTITGMQGVGGSSVVFTPTDNVTSIMTVYGKLANCYVDMQNRVFVGAYFILGTSATIDGVEITSGSADATTNTTIFGGNNVGYINIRAKVDQYIPTSNANNSGALVNINNSSNCFINLTVVNSGGTTGNGQSVWLTNINNGSLDGNFDNVGGRFLIASGTSTNLQLHGNYHITRKCVTAFFGVGEGFSGVSTGTIISNATFIFDVPGGVTTTALITDYGNGAPGGNGRVSGLLIKNIYAYAIQSTVTNFIDNGEGGNTQEYNLNVIDCHTFGIGTFITDAGFGTKTASLSNTKDGIPQ